MYKIKEYSFKKAKELDVVIKPSLKKNKKIDVYKNNVLITSIGNKNYLDYPTYIDEKGLTYANIRKQLFNIRHKNNNKLAGFYAKKILW